MAPTAGGSARVLVFATLGGDRGAFAVALEAAALLADSGQRTLLLEAARGPLPFERVLEGLADPRRPPVRNRLSVKPASPEEDAAPSRNLGLDAADVLQRVVSPRMRERFDVIVAFVPFDGRSDTWPFLVGADAVFLTLSAGRTDEATVRAVAERCGAYGDGPDGVVVVDPDPGDTTTGRGPARPAREELTAPPGAGTGAPRLASVALRPTGTEQP
jgi:hypothetical protein